MRARKEIMWTLAMAAMCMLFTSFGLSPLHAGSLQPPGAPAPTMKTLNQVPPTWSQTLPANDGTSCNSSRFECVFGGNAVLDKETGLVWAKNAYIRGSWVPWAEAMDYCATIQIGGRGGWRLPTIQELMSLADYSTTNNPRLPTGHPFLNIRTDAAYWSSTDTSASASNAFTLLFNYPGNVYAYAKTNLKHLWPVRGGISN